MQVIIIFSFCCKHVVDGNLPHHSIPYPPKAPWLTGTTVAAGARCPFADAARMTTRCRQYIPLAHHGVWRPAAMRSWISAVCMSMLGHVCQFATANNLELYFLGLILTCNFGQSKKRRLSLRPLSRLKQTCENWKFFQNSETTRGHFACGRRGGGINVKWDEKMLMESHLWNNKKRKTIGEPFYAIVAGWNKDVQVSFATVLLSGTWCL